MRGREYRGRPLGALFRVLAAILPAFCSPVWAGSAIACDADRIDERVTVAYVHDGDTVRLEDGRRVRLIGFDTPELGRNGGPDQPLAQAARARLDTWIADAGGRLDLRYDTERHDRYQRTLAHAYLPDGRGIAAAMLTNGLATTLMVPPNFWSMDCNRRAERAARADNQGIWALSAYRARQATDLTGHDSGFVIVRGRVLTVNRSNRSVWLPLAGPLSLRIARSDLKWFGDLDRYKGEAVEVRGWLTIQGGTLQIRIRHPSALIVLNGRQ